MEAIQRVKGQKTTNNLIPVITKIKNVWNQHVVCESALYFGGFFSGVNFNISMQISASPHHCARTSHFHDIKSRLSVLASPVNNIPPPDLVHMDFQHVAPEEEGAASRHSLHKHRSTAGMKPP